MQIVIANKAQFGNSLPILLVAKYVELNVSTASLETVLEDIEKLDANGKEASVVLKTEDGKVLADDEVIYYLRDTYEPLQVGAKENVRGHPFLLIESCVVFDFWCFPQFVVSTVLT